jgi:hypothetical protein
MIGEIYNNRKFYYEIIKEFLEGKKTALELQTEYWEQRDKDLDVDSKNGYYEYEANYEGNEKQFEKENKEKLYFSAWSKEWREVLAEYEEAANRLEIKGELFFKGIWNFIDEYVREYNPSDASFFNPEEDVDEEELEEKLRAAYEVLERNKERWM